MTKGLQTLGHGIFRYAGSEPDQLAKLHQHQRFMNELWLPCSLEQLNHDQLVVINRFREAHMSTERQFQHADTARRAVQALIGHLRATAVLEIGCGKYPLVRRDMNISYLGIEIDEESISHCRSLGVEVLSLSEANARRNNVFDLAVSLYVMHFAIGDDLIAFIYESIPKGLFIYNIIVDDDVTPPVIIERFSNIFSISYTVKCQWMARRERFMIHAAPRQAEAAERAFHFLSQWGAPALSEGCSS